MTLTWRSTLLLTVVAGLTLWYLERELSRAAAAVVQPVVSAAQGVADADPLARGSVWDTIRDAVEIPVGGSTAAVDRWIRGAGQ